MSVELLGAVTPIHMVGESHSLSFSNLLFRPEWSQETFLCHTRFFPTLMAAQYLTQQMLNAEFVDGLVAEGILDKAMRPAFMHAGPSAAYIAGMPIISPPVVLFAGDMDLHQVFLQIANKFDFKLPADPVYGVDKDKQMLTYTVVRDQILSFMSPFLDAIDRLRTMNFNRLMIHCLPPRAADNIAASRWTGGTIVNAPVRAKLTLVANRLIEDFCTKSGIAFIDTWPELAENGYLRSEFELDGVHVNRKAALISLDIISAHLFDQTSTIWNPARYLQASLQADPYTNISNDLRGKEWQDIGLVAGRVNGDVAANLCRNVSFDLGQQNIHARPDWIGWPRAGRSGITLAEPEESALAEAATILGQDEGLAILHAGAERELTIISFRPVRFSPAVEKFNTLPAPPGARRALLYLAESSRVSFETLDGRAIPCPAADRGSLIVYDPQRVRFRIGSSQYSLDLVELALIPRLSGQPFRIVWAGLCDWPADPFQFSVTNMKAFPAFKGHFFRERARQ